MNHAITIGDVLLASGLVIAAIVTVCVIVSLFAAYAKSFFR